MLCVCGDAVVHMGESRKSRRGDDVRRPLLEAASSGVSVFALYRPINAITTTISAQRPPQPPYRAGIASVNAPTHPVAVPASFLHLFLPSRCSFTAPYFEVLLAAYLQPDASLEFMYDVVKKRGGTGGTMVIKSLSNLIKHNRKYIIDFLHIVLLQPIGQYVTQSLLYECDALASVIEAGRSFRICFSLTTCDTLTRVPHCSGASAKVFSGEYREYISDDDDDDGAGGGAGAASGNGGTYGGTHNGGTESATRPRRNASKGRADEGRRCIIHNVAVKLITPPEGLNDTVVRLAYRLHMSALFVRAVGRSYSRARSLMCVIIALTRHRLAHIARTRAL